MKVREKKRIDYVKPLRREDIDLVVYNAKFEKCDYYNSLKFKKGDEYRVEETNLLKELLKDVTCFAYLYFKLDGKPFKLYPYQDAIVNDKHRFKIFRAANQIGKSILLDVNAAYNLIMDHGYTHNEAIVSKSLPQAMDQMRRVKSILNTCKLITWKEEKGDLDNMSIITYDVVDGEGKLKYTNSFICAPCTEGLLGYTLHELNLDEFEYWDVDIKYFFNQIAQPRTYTTKGNITIFSNPNGQDSFVAELEVQKFFKKNENKWHTYIFDFLDKPGNTQEEYDQLKSELSRQEFESTVAAIRSLSDRNYFSPDEIENSFDGKLKQLDMVGKQPFFFLDVGSKHDQSVLIGGFIEPDDKDDRFNHIYIPIIHVYPVGYPLARVVGADEETIRKFDAFSVHNLKSKDALNTDGWHVEKSIKDYIDEWSKDGTVPTLGVDVTGNSGIVPLLNAVGLHPDDVTFSGPVKSGMYQRFKYFMEKGLLHRIRSKEWEYQAAHMEVKKSQRGYLLIHHERESDLDDCMDATAGLIFLADSPIIVPPSMRII